MHYKHVSDEVCEEFRNTQGCPTLILLSMVMEYGSYVFCSLASTKALPSIASVVFVFACHEL